MWWGKFLRVFPNFPSSLLSTKRDGGGGYTDMESEGRRGEKGMHGTELLQAFFSPLVSRGREGLVFFLGGGGFLFCFVGIIFSLFTIAE